jgi:hypothetical protein
LARVFIDGYITTANEVVDCVVGASIEATGCASYDDTWPDTGFFPRLRIRDRADVVCTIPEPEKPATPVADVESGEVEAGTVVTFSCETEGAVIWYSLDGETWIEGDSITVTEDVTVQVKAVLDGVESEIAEFTYTVKTAAETYTVTFVDWDGTVLKTETVNYGGAATAPADPTRDGYTFTGWDVAFNNITANLTVTAQYTQNEQPPVITADGDINGDGTVNSTDALLALRYSMGSAALTDEQLARGDVNGDGIVNATDAIMIMRMALRVIA